MSISVIVSKEVGIAAHNYNVLIGNKNNFTDATPTMLQLTQLDAQEIGVSVRIMDRIGSDYNTLGTYLLNDEYGEIMRTIKRDYKFTEEILDEVFHRWIKGQGQKDGKKMNNWETLVACLKRSQLMALADEIERVLHFCAEKTLHIWDDEECVREHMHEAPMKIKSFLGLQHLVPMLATVMCVGAALCYCYRRKHHKCDGRTYYANISTHCSTYIILNSRRI